MCDWPVVVLFHGSRQKEACESSVRLTNFIKKKLQNRRVEAAYLSIGEPKLEAVVSRLATEKVTKLSILPAFLFKGVHFQKDVQACISRVKENFPNLDIELAEPIGACEDVADILMQRLESCEQNG